jgi:hypothetical protein
VPLEALHTADFLGSSHMAYYETRRFMIAYTRSPPDPKNLSLRSNLTIIHMLFLYPSLSTRATSSTSHRQKTMTPKMIEKNMTYDYQGDVNKRITAVWITSGKNEHPHQKTTLLMQVQGKRYVKPPGDTIS